jgi:hypothetical protein
MSKDPKKFYFTQISAPLVGFAGLFLQIGTAKHFHWLTDFKSVSQIILLIFILVVGLIGSMVLWGRLLVVVGILTKEEAKGYPYAKPWEKGNTT